MGFISFFNEYLVLLKHWLIQNSISRVVITSQEWGNRRRALQLKLHRPSKEELKKMPLFGE